jgi:hypothetical protein
MTAKADREQTIRTITRLWGKEAAEVFVDARTSDDATSMGTAIASLREVMATLGLGSDQVDKLRKVFDERNGPNHTMVFELPGDVFDPGTDPGTGGENEGLEVPEGRTGELTVNADGTSEAHLVEEPVV